MKIVFVLAVHKPTDDRVWNQQASILRQVGHDVFIISARAERTIFQNVYCFDNQKEMTSRKETIAKFVEFLQQIKPDAIICDNPVSIFAANNYKKKSRDESVKLYYDITEFYPAKIHLYYNNFFKNLLKFCLLYCISIYAGFLVDHFIFGDYYKSKRYTRLFFWKRYVNVSYFADLLDIKVFPINKEIKKECSLFYAGYLTENAGFPAVFNVAEACAKRFSTTKFTLNIISKTLKYEQIYSNMPNLVINYKNFTPYSEFCQTVGSSDLFFDLRSIDMENTRCLPIKLFYYMATARPVIYSNLKSIRKEIAEIDEFGFLVNPKDIDDIVEKIGYYINNQKFYEQHCKKAYELAVAKYNWGKIWNSFVEFIEMNIKYSSFKMG
ncbi:MAG: glycosyltransferase [Bacteroidales bacterium]|jgi:glycosyltransferase involved in cell wall biosynthesis|nr:glycosyltransferase [Bacteroidales bacterium]